MLALSFHKSQWKKENELHTGMPLGSSSSSSDNLKSYNVLSQSLSLWMTAWAFLCCRGSLNGVDANFKSSPKRLMTNESFLGCCYCCCQFWQWTDKSVSNWQHPISSWWLFSPLFHLNDVVVLLCCWSPRRNASIRRRYKQRHPEDSGLAAASKVLVVLLLEQSACRIKNEYFLLLLMMMILTNSAWLMLGHSSQANRHGNNQDVSGRKRRTVAATAASTFLILVACTSVNIHRIVFCFQPW